MKISDIKFLLLLLTLGLLVINPKDSLAGKKDTLIHLAPIHKNVIKLNPSRAIFWDISNLALSYERFIHRNQTAAITVGYLRYGTLFKNDKVLDIIEITSRQSGGFSVTLEYRFYPFARNRRPVPDGLFFGPYTSYYGYWFENDLNLLKGNFGTGNLKAEFHMFNLGFELGYQFVFWKRLTLDLVMIGPSLSYYHAKGTLTANINIEDAELLNTEFFTTLRDTYPILANISKTVEFDNKGRMDFFSVGFRYVIQIGFHF